MKKQELKRIGRFALFGAIGFGIGAVIAVVIYTPAYAEAEKQFNIFLLFIALVGAFAIQGALGGVALGLASKKGVWNAIELAVLGAIGFGIGSVAIAFLSPWRQLPPISAILGAVWGLIGAGALGLRSRGRQTIMVLASAGALGFGIGIAVFSPGVALAWGWGSLLRWGLVGMFGGASIGAGLGYLEKRQSSTGNKSD